MIVGNRALRALGFQQITSLATSTGLTIPAGTSAVVWKSTGQNIRWRDDGTDPTGSIGFLHITTAEPFVYDFSSFSRLRFIETAASAVLNICYYG